MNIIKNKYKNLSDDSVLSIYSQEITKHVKKNYHQFIAPSNIFNIYRRFQEYVKQKKTNIILGLSQEYKFPSSIIAKELLRIYLSECSNYKNVSDNKLKKLYKNPDEISDTIIRNEYVEAIREDKEFGIESSQIRNQIGSKYEEILETKLKDLDISYSNEKTLRASGFSKTPDILLDIPIAVGGEHVITWIESKALFCDGATFLDHITNQLRSYNNVYGPGMVIYWFGYVEDIKRLCEFPLIIVTDFPSNIIKLEDLLN